MLAWLVSGLIVLKKLPFRATSSMLWPEITPLAIWSRLARSMKLEQGISLFSGT